MWWAYIRGGAYIRGTYIRGGAYSRRFTVWTSNIIVTAMLHSYSSTISRPSEIIGGVVTSPPPSFSATVIIDTKDNNFAKK